MNKELWDWGDEQQEQESQAPKRSLFDNLGDAITAIGANFSDVRGSNNIGDLRHELMERGSVMPLEEYNRKVAELEQLYGEREASRQQYQQAHDNLVANDSFLKNIDQLGGTLEGMAAQGIGTAVGAGLGLVGGVGGAAMGAKIGNAAGAVAGGYLDARSVALQAEEEVLDAGGTWEQAKQAYDEALKKASLTTLPETLADIAMGNRLVRAGLSSGVARKIAGSTLGRAGSAVLDPAARLGTKAAFASGKGLVGRGVGLATDIALQGATEAGQEVTQDYIENREVAKALGQQDNEYSLGGFKDFALSPQGLETMKTAGIMGALFGGAGGALSSGQYLTRGAETNTGIRAHNNAEQMINDGSLKISAEKRRDEEKIISVLKGISPAELASWSDAEIVAEASILEGQYMGVQGEAEDLSTVRGAADVVRRLSDENTGVHREGDLTETTNKFLEGMGVDKEQRQRMFNSPAEMSIIEQARKAQEAEAQAKTQTQEQEGTQKKNAPVTATLTEKTAKDMPKTEDGTITTKTDETQEQAQAPQIPTQPIATPKAVTETPSQKSAANHFEQAAKVQEQQGKITTEQQDYKDNIGGGWETDQERLDESLDEHPYYNLKTGAEVTITHRADGQYAILGEKGEGIPFPTLKDAEQYLKDHKDQTVFQGTNGEETEETKEGTVEDPNIVPKGGVNAREGFSGQLISSVDDLYNFMLKNPNLISRGAFIEYVHAKHNIGFDNIDIYLDKKNEGRVYDSKTGKWGYVNAKKTRDEATGRAILQLYKGADFISAVHEIAHIGYDNLTAAEQRTFDKYAVKSMGQWIADMLDLNYDDAFKQRLNNLQNDQELQEKINKSPALRQTVIEFLNAEKNGIDLNNLTKNQREAIDERWAWEFSLWYTEGYIRGVQPKNVVERLLQRGCFSIRDELEGLHRLWEHIHHKDNNEIEDLYRNMGTNVERKQGLEGIQFTNEFDRPNMPNINMPMNFGGEQSIQYNVPTLGESYDEAQEYAGLYNELERRYENRKKYGGLSSADGSVATNKDRPINTENGRKTTTGYKERTTSAAKNKREAEKLVKIIEGRKSGWERALEKLAYVDPKRFRSIKIQDGNDLWEGQGQQPTKQQEEKPIKLEVPSDGYNTGRPMYFNPVGEQTLKDIESVGKEQKELEKAKDDIHKEIEELTSMLNKDLDTSELYKKSIKIYKLLDSYHNMDGYSNSKQDRAAFSNYVEHMNELSKEIHKKDAEKTKNRIENKFNKADELFKKDPLSEQLSNLLKEIEIDINRYSLIEKLYDSELDSKLFEQFKERYEKLLKQIEEIKKQKEESEKGVSLRNPKTAIKYVNNNFKGVDGLSDSAKIVVYSTYKKLSTGGDMTKSLAKENAVLYARICERLAKIYNECDSSYHYDAEYISNEVDLKMSKSMYRGSAMAVYSRRENRELGKLLELSRRAITVYKSARHTSFLHEVAHMFDLELELIATKFPNSQAAKDWNTLREWAEYKGKQQEEADAKTLGRLASITQGYINDVERARTDFSRKEALRYFRQEKIAQGFEEYLKSGEAPTNALKEIFQKLKDFVKTLFKDFELLGIKPSPEVKEVFDKMIMTDDEIKQRQEEKQKKENKPKQEPKQKERTEAELTKMVDDMTDDISKWSEEEEKSLYGQLDKMLQSGEITQEDYDYLHGDIEYRILYGRLLNKYKEYDYNKFDSQEEAIKFVDDEEELDDSDKEEIIEHIKQEFAKKPQTVKPEPKTVKPVKQNKPQEIKEQPKEEKVDFEKQEQQELQGVVDKFSDQAQQLDLEQDDIDNILEQLEDIKENIRDAKYLKDIEDSIADMIENGEEEKGEFLRSYLDSVKNVREKYQQKEATYKKEYQEKAERELPKVEEKKKEEPKPTKKEEKPQIGLEEKVQQLLDKRKKLREERNLPEETPEQIEKLREDYRKILIAEQGEKINKPATTKPTKKTTKPTTKPTTAKKADPLSALHKKYKYVTGTPIGEKGYVFKSDEKAFIEGFKGLIDGAVGNKEQLINVAKQLDSWFQNDPTERNRMVRKYLSQYLADAAQIKANQNTEVRHQEANRAEQAQQILDSAFPDTRFQYAWHGTPYNFNRFTLEHLLKGEGAMVHGWGLYFGLSPKIIKKYYFNRFRTGKRFFSINNEDITDLIENVELDSNLLFHVTTGMKNGANIKNEQIKKMANNALKYLKEEREEQETELKKLEEERKNLEKYLDTEFKLFSNKRNIIKVETEIKEIDSSINDANKLLGLLNTGTVEIKENRNKNASLILVDIPENNVLLKDYARFEEQSPFVRKQILKLIKDVTGSSLREAMQIIDENSESAYEDQKDASIDLYSIIQTLIDENRFKCEGRTIDEKASRLLNKYGIKGLSYDGQQDGECAVIFDNTAIDILSKFKQEEGKWVKESGEFNTQNRQIEKEKANKKLQKYKDKQSPLYKKKLSELSFDDIEKYSSKQKGDNTRFQLHSEEGLSKADTNSPEFKKWFEGSILTNKDGSPKVFYRGIRSHYDPTFDKEEGGAVWITEDREQAEAFRDTNTYEEVIKQTGKVEKTTYHEPMSNVQSGDIAEVYANVKKPFNVEQIMRDGSNHEQYMHIDKMLQRDVKNGIITEQQRKQVLNDLSYLNKMNKQGQYPKASHTLAHHFPNKKFFNALKKVGYDSIQGYENDVMTYGVFDKGNIKSIYNRGTFDKNNKDIRYMYGGNQADNQTLLTPKLEKEYEKNFRNYMRLHGFSEAFIDKYFSNDKTGKEQMIPDNVLKGRNLFNKSFEEVFNEYNKQMVKDKGVKRGLDGRWRFEFSDKESKIDSKFVSNAFISKVVNDASKKYETKLQNVLKHDKLFEHYPELKEFKVVFATSKYDGLEDADGYSDFNEIALNVDSLKKEKNEKARLSRIRRTLLHEVQHQIQDREGFASGGGATRRELQDRQKDFVTSYINKLGGDIETGKKLINAIEDVIKNIKKVPRNKRGALYDKIRNNAEYFGDNERDFIRKHVKAIINGYINDYQNENKKFGNYINNEIKEMCEYLSLSKDLNMNEELLKPIRQFRNVYWTTMGEIEARQTEQRADMTMEERSERTDVLDESVRKMKSFKDAPILVKETIPNIVDDEETRFQETTKPLTDEEIEEMDKKEEAEYKKRQKRIEDAKDSATLSDDYKDVYSVAFTKSAQGYAENRTRMEYFDNNDRYWDRTEDKSTGKVTYTRKTPFEHHQQVVTYNGVNDVTREEKKKSKPRQWLEWMKDQLIKYMFNDKHYLAKAARKLGVYDAYRKMIVTEGYALKANTALTQGIKYNGKRTRALNDIIRDVGEENQKDFIDYCIAHRIIDLANRTRLEKVKEEDGDTFFQDGFYYKKVAAPIFQKMKPDEARKIIADVKAGKNAELFEKNRKDFVEYNQALLHVLVEGGILTEKKFKEFCEVDPNFVPLAKVMDDADFGFSSIIAAHNLVNVETPIKKIGTSMREVANPFLEMQKRTAEYYSAAARNKAGQIFVNEIAEALDIKYDGNVVARGQQMINRVKVQEVNGELITKPDDKKQIIYVCNNGEHQFYQIPDREIYEALRSMDSEQMGTIHKMLDRIAHVPSGLVRETATMVPDFGVRNLIRDGGEAFLTSEHGFLPVIDQIWGMWQVANNTEWAQMYFEQNGEYGTLNRDKVNAEGVASVEDVIDEKLNPLTNFNEIKKAQMAILKDKKRQFDILTDIKDGNFGDAWEHTRKSRGMAALKLAISPLWAIGKTNKRMNDLFELGTRVGEFKNAKMGFEGTLDRMAKGLLNTDIRQAKQSDIYSAHVAKDITLNFAQHGVLGKQLNRYIPFFNASLQGIYKLCNTIETMVTGTTMSGGKNRKLQQELLFKAALITAMAIGVASAGDGDEDYEEAPDYEKENFWILPNGLRFPKDQVLGKVIGNTVEKSYAQWKRGKAEPSDILRAIIDNFKPDKFMPAIFDLAIGGFGNYDTFRERAIVPEYMADKLGHLQKDISTSNFAVDVSEALWKCGFNISAKKIDWALQKNFSNCAKYATSIYDLGKKGFNPKDFNERIARGYDKNDSTGAFVAGLKDDVPNPINLVSGTFATNRSTFKSISDFYENYRKYKVLSSDEASMSKEDKRIWKRYEQAYKKDMTFRKQLRAIKQDKNLTGKQKREKADKIFKQQIKLAKWAEG